MPGLHVERGDLPVCTMNPSVSLPTPLRRLGTGIVLLSVVCLFADNEGRAARDGDTPSGDARQEHVHHRGAHVMPFALGKTQHIFEMTDTGGVMRVVARDPKDAEQIGMIRQHLEHEAGLFAQGDFSDPMRLHGKEMPGLSELAAAGPKLQVRYAATPEGAEVTFTSNDVHVITAVHRWFGAQLSDHGADATSR